MILIKITGILYFSLLVMYKIELAPANLLDYVKGTYILTTTWFLILLCMSRGLMKLASVGVLATILSISFASIINGIYSKIDDVMQINIDYIQEITLICASIIAMFVSSTLTIFIPILSMCVHFVTLIVMIALFQKLENHPLADPFVSENVFMTSLSLYMIISLLFRIFIEGIDRRFGIRVC
jgi:hypothetical protein